MKKIYIISLFLHFVIESSGQSGCTDPQALNYNPSAVINNGSCNYPSTNLALQLKANLASPTLDESSGIEFIGNSLWTHNDSGNNNILYRVDSTNGCSPDHDICQLVAELETVLASPYEHCILVDDARAFLAPPPPPFDYRKWPSLDQIFAAVAKRPGYNIVTIADVLIIVPDKHRHLVAQFCFAIRPKI